MTPRRLTMIGVWLVIAASTLTFITIIVLAVETL